MCTKRKMNVSVFRQFREAQGIYANKNLISIYLYIYMYTLTAKQSCKIREKRGADTTLQ